MFLVTPEMSDKVKRQGFYITKEKSIFIYEIESNAELKLFKDGVVCDDLEEVFFIIERVKNANRGRIQKQVGRLRYNYKSVRGA